MTPHTLVAVSLAVGLARSAAMAAPPEPDIAEAVAQAAGRYAAAISCTEDEITPARVAALRPYRSDADRRAARYAVVWHGDIGCRGGAGQYRAHIAIVAVGAGDSFFVDPARSSPAVRFVLPVRWVETVQALGPDTLLLQGLVHADGDAQCCPSRQLSFRLKAGAGGHWKPSDRPVAGPADTSQAR